MLPDFDADAYLKEYGTEIPGETLIKFIQPEFGNFFSLDLEREAWYEDKSLSYLQAVFAPTLVKNVLQFFQGVVFTDEGSLVTSDSGLTWLRMALTTTTYEQGGTGQASYYYLFKGDDLYTLSFFFVLDDQGQVPQDLQAMMDAVVAGITLAD